MVDTLHLLGYSTGQKWWLLKTEHGLERVTGSEARQTSQTGSSVPLSEGRWTVVMALKHGGFSPFVFPSFLFLSLICCLYSL